MAVRSISATYNSKESGVDPRQVNANFNQPESLADASDRFTEAVVLSIFNQQAVVKLQSFERSLAKQGKTDDEIQSAVDGWVPGTSAGRAKKTPLDRALAAVDEMSPDDYGALLAKVKEQKAALQSR